MAEAGNDPDFFNAIEGVKIQSSDGRTTASGVIDLAVVALTTYAVMETMETSYKLMNGYLQYKKETGKSFDEYVEENDTEFLVLGIDILTAGSISKFKVLSKIPGINSKNIAKVMSSARKLGLKTKEGIKKLAGLKQQKRALEGATDAAKHELYKKQLRQSMPKPEVNDKKLFEIIDDNYRPNAKVGSGSTADALRHEKLTGNPVGGKMHGIKAREQVTRIQKWLDKNPNAVTSDKSAAEKVMLDLMEALGDI
jgi:hypothetical protein